MLLNLKEREMAKRVENTRLAKSTNKHVKCMLKSTIKSDKRSEEKTILTNSKISYPRGKVPPLSNFVAAGTKKKKKQFEDDSSDETISSEDSSVSLISKQTLKKKKGDSELNSQLTSELIHCWKGKLNEMSQVYESATIRATGLENSLEDAKFAFLSLSSIINENCDLLQHNTVQKFHAIERKKERMLKRFHAIQYMIKEFGEDLEKTKKNLNFFVA